MREYIKQQGKHSYNALENVVRSLHSIDSLSIQYTTSCVICPHLHILLPITMKILSP